MIAPRRLIGALALALSLCGGTTPVLAQVQGHVIRDRSIIWRSDISIVAATVPAGTILTVVADLGDWYEVIIPAQFGGNGERGRIAKALLQVSGTAPAVTAGGSAGGDRPRTGAGQDQRVRRRSRPSLESSVAVRGFGQVGYSSFTAGESLNALLGQSHGLFLGGGAQLRFGNGIFIEGAWERFRKDGHRVFVFEDTVYELETPNTVTITPISVSGGFRFRRSATVVPFVAAGFSQYRLRETTPFTTPDEEYDERLAGYHATGGVELRARRWLGTAVELRYTTVGDAIGRGGVSELFNERDLGGMQVQLKVLIGR